MDNTNTYITRIEDSSREITMADINQLAGHAENMVGTITNTINNVAITTAEISRISANVQIQCAQLEHALDCLMLRAQRDIKIYEMSLPILNKQFDFCQTRLDKLMDKAMDFICSDLSSEALSRQEGIMTLIELANNSLNSLITKLIPAY